MKFEEPVFVSKDFVKMKSGEPVIGVFRGDPHVFTQHWVNKKPSNCGVGCVLCAAGDKARKRFRVNLLQQIGKGNYEPKILEAGMSVYKQLRELQEGGYNLERTLVKITRSGEGLQTNYTVVPVPKGDIPDDLNTVFLSIELHDLKQGPETKAEPTKMPSNYVGSSGEIPPDEVPF